MMTVDEQTTQHNTRKGEKKLWLIREKQLIAMQ